MNRRGFLLGISALVASGQSARSTVPVPGPSAVWRTVSDVEPLSYAQSIIDIDATLKSMWDNYKLTPATWYFYPDDLAPAMEFARQWEDEVLYGSPDAHPFDGLTR